MNKTKIDKQFDKVMKEQNSVLDEMKKNEIKHLKEIGQYETEKWGQIRVYRISKTGQKEYLTDWFTPRGGKREGAGRPNKDGYKRVQINARIAKGAYDKLMTIKGDLSLGEILDKIIYDFKVQ